MIYPSVVKNYKVFNGSSYLVGNADIVLPKIIFEKNDVKGAGIGGSVNLPVVGNVQPMVTTMSFHTNTLQNIQLFNGSSAQIFCLSDLMTWDTVAANFAELPEEVIMTCIPDEFDLGKRDPSTKAVVTLQLSVVKLALYWNGTAYYNIDPMNNICVMDGTDLNQQTRINISVS